MSSYHKKQKSLQFFLNIPYIVELFVLIISVKQNFLI